MEEYLKDLKFTVFALAGIAAAFAAVSVIGCLIYLYPWVGAPALVLLLPIALRYI